MKKGKRPRSQNRLRLPKNGERLTDQIFLSFSKILRRVKIYKVNDLRHPIDRRIRTSGFFDNNTIWINPNRHPKVPAAKILVHELWHALLAQDEFLSEDTEEKLVDDLENIFWDKLTDDQKKMLEGHIPKHCVKLKPK